jgi:hypothetical protein
MSIDYFDRQLDQRLDFSTVASDPYGQSYEALKQIAGSIERKLNDGLPESPIKVEIEPGFQANMGQQLRVNIRIPTKQFRDTLFRAYIPVDGMPILLDLYGEEPEKCSDPQELQDKVLEFLLRLKDRMASYRDYARQ